MHVALFKEVTQKIDLMNVIRLIFLAISLYYMPEGMPKHENTQWLKKLGEVWFQKLRMELRKGDNL